MHRLLRALGSYGHGCLWSLRRKGTAGNHAAARQQVAILPLPRRRLDEAFVLESAAAAVVVAAEAGGPRFAVGPVVAACSRPGSVTCWAEYVRGPGGPEARHVYTHRMEVVGVVAAAADAAELPGTGMEGGVTCEACDLDLAARPVRLTYLGATFDVEPPACPSCGAVFVSRELAAGRKREVEASLEDK